MKKKLVKITIIFFLLMVVFTIMSRAAENLTIPRVALAKTERMELGHEVVSSGIVEFNQEKAVSSLAEQIVETVAVIPGQRVTPGDLLYTVQGTQLSKNIRLKEEAIAVLDLASQQMASSNDVASQQHDMTWQQARNEYERVIDQGNETVAQREQELAEARAAYEEFVNDPEKYPELTIDELQASINERQDSYNRAVSERDESIANAKDRMDLAGISISRDTTIEQNNIQKAQLERELAELRALQVDERKVRSNINGIVTEVNLKAGSITTGTSDILIGDFDTGAKVTASFTEADKKYISSYGQVLLKEGDRSLLNGQSETFSIQGIAPNSTDSDLTDVTVFLSEDIAEIGKKVSMSVVTEAKEYETCIPRSGLNRDNTGNYFVYVVEEFKSVLGDELKVVEIPVEVVDENNSYVAIEGVDYGQEIVISATKIIEKGSRVKLQEIE